MQKNISFDVEKDLLNNTQELRLLSAWGIDFKEGKYTQEDERRGRQREFVSRKKRI